MSLLPSVAEELDTLGSRRLRDGHIAGSPISVDVVGGCVAFRESGGLGGWPAPRRRVSPLATFGARADRPVDAAEGARVQAGDDFALQAPQLPVLFLGFVLVHQANPAQAEAEKTEQERLEEEIDQDVSVAQHDVQVDQSREGQADLVEATRVCPILVKDNRAPDAQAEQHEDVHWKRDHMQDERVPET